MVLQPVREAVSYRGLFTAGWFDVREKHYFRLKIYDRLRANEHADAHPHRRANRSRTRAGRLNRQRPRRRASPLRRPHTLARCGAAARTSWHRRLASAVCRQVHSFVNGTRMANELALKERSHRMQSLVSFFLAVLYEYWTIRLMKLLRILCKNLYAFTWERKGNS